MTPTSSATEEIDIEIAGIRTRLRLPAGGRLSRHVRQRYGDFVVPATTAPDFCLVYRVTPQTAYERSRETEPPPKSKLAWSQPSRSCLTARWRDVRARYDVETRTGSVACWRGNHRIAIETSLRICYSLLLTERAGVMLHAAGVARRDVGYAFAGVSGAGKSTIVSLRTPVEEVLSDELVAVRREAHAYRIYGTPFYGTETVLPTARGADLGALYFPVKDRRDCLRPISPADAVRNILRCTLDLRWTGEYADALMAAATDLASRVTTARLHFAMKPSFWRLVGQGAPSRERTRLA